MNVALFIARKISKESTEGHTGKIIKVAIFTISLSIAIMIISSTFIEGFKNEIAEKIFGFWGNIHISDSRIIKNFDAKPIQQSSQVVDSIKSIGIISYTDVNSGKEYSTRGGVKHLYAFVTCPGIIQAKESMDGIILKGVNEKFPFDDFQQYLIHGVFPEIGHSESSSRQILISEQTSKRLQLNVGDNVTMHFVIDKNRRKRRFKVSGLYKTGLEEYDSKFAIVDYKILQQVLSWEDNQISGYQIHLDDERDADIVADYIYQDVLPSHLYAETIQDKHRSIFEWLELQNINEIIILVLMALVAIINMATALIIIILERSNMVGILKSLGMPDNRIRKIFIYNALAILGFAMLIGNGFAFIVCLVQKYFGVIKLDEDNYYLSSVPVDFNMLHIVAINLVTIIITLVVMILPTYMVAKLSPTKILRLD